VAAAETIPGVARPAGVPSPDHRRAKAGVAERGITLSREQLWRLVSQPPQYLSLDVLAAMCDFLGCGPSDLIKVRAENTSVRKTGTDPAGVARHRVVPLSGDHTRQRDPGAKIGGHRPTTTTCPPAP